MKKIKIALAGNPNCGKTTLFNALTGSKQRVGNWPGVTVERKEGSYSHDELEIEIIDLPGIYSFSAYSLDEKVSRDFILQEKPDFVVNIIDATNLERNLYLTTQLLEMKVPIIVALNMMDIAKQRRIHIQVEHLSKHLNCPVIPIIANKNKGLAELKECINNMSYNKNIPKTEVQYDSIVEKAINNISETISEFSEKNQVNKRWLAIKLLELDELAINMTDNKFQKIVKNESREIERHTGDEVDIVIADGRYGFIHGLSKDVIRRDDQVRKLFSDKMDRFVLNRFLGIPIFLLIMYLVFVITINIGGGFIDFFDIFTGTIFVDGLSSILSKIHSPEWIITLLANGIGGGIQTVATFIPPIFFMFLSLSILEDSGYMSRAAFVMDKAMTFIGLPGKAFIPMIVGFGCNVPAIMATRTLENNRDRILTILMNPFMSCGARLPVYVLFATVFFPHSGGLIVFTIYMTGILLAIISGLLFKKTILKREASTFVMELPPYHIPTFNGIITHTWNKLKSFIFRAGKVIVIVVTILSFLNTIGVDGSFGNDNSEKSVLSYIGKSLTPIFKPMGIQKNNWPATVGLFTGIFAKEAVVGTLNNLYSPTNEDDDGGFDFWGGIGESFQSIKDAFSGVGSSFKDPLGISAVEGNLDDEKTQAEEQEVSTTTFEEMRKRFGNSKAAFAYLLFILIYMPCVAAIAAVYRETNIKWTIFLVSYLTILAWIVSTMFYQISTFGSHPGISSIWIISLAGFVIIAYFMMKYKSRNIKISE